MDVVSFRLPADGDTALSNMNFLWTQQHFCDVTIVAGGRRMFRGHKVVLAACSVFLMDQFLMNPSSELQQVSMLHSSAVVFELLQSCYTGMLQFSAKEIVNYLTAASYLQMEHVVEKCRGALSQYMQPRSCIPVTVKSEDCPSMPVIVSVRSDASGHFEGEDGPESDVFQVQISDEHQDPEKTSGAEEEDREAVVMLDDHGQLDAGIEEPNMEGRAKGNGIRGAGRVWRRRHGEQRGGRGRGFKHRKRYTFKDRKLMGNYQDYQEHLTKPDETMGNFGADFQANNKSNQYLADGSVFAEYRPGEGQGEGIGSDGGPAHFGVEASSGEQGTGVGTHTNEHGAADESVAVVGIFAHKSALHRHLIEQHGKTMPQNHMEMQRNNEWCWARV
uniref:Zinc finger and BTB domain containing 12, tandem duplicate 1 n=1 Tax=Cyprinus carpio TaxID=7962 RepID=A0A8C2FC24_CYPCA